MLYRAHIIRFTEPTDQPLLSYERPMFVPFSISLVHNPQVELLKPLGPDLSLPCPFPPVSRSVSASSLRSLRTWSEPFPSASLSLCFVPFELPTSSCPAGPVLGPGSLFPLFDLIARNLVPPFLITTFLFHLPSAVTRQKRTPRYSFLSRIIFEPPPSYLRSLSCLSFLVRLKSCLFSPRCSLTPVLQWAVA